MDSLDVKIFGKKTFSGLLEEIYNNQKRKESQISSLISELKPLIGDIGDATLIVPLIKEYLEIGVKNDEQLIKLATIIQRIQQASAASDTNNPFVISEEEKNQLLESIDKIKKDVD
jgi:hypothetical protein